MSADPTTGELARILARHDAAITSHDERFRDLDKAFAALDKSSAERHTAAEVRDVAVAKDIAEMKTIITMPLVQRVVGDGKALSIVIGAVVTMLTALTASAVALGYASAPTTVEQVPVMVGMPVQSPPAACCAVPADTDPH